MNDTTMFMASDTIAPFGAIVGAIGMIMRPQVEGGDAEEAGGEIGIDVRERTARYRIPTRA